MFTNPPGDTLLHDGDHVYVFGHPRLVDRAMRSISRPLYYKLEGKVAMPQEEISVNYKK